MTFERELFLVVRATDERVVPTSRPATRPRALVDLSTLRAKKTGTDFRLARLEVPTVAPYTDFWEAARPVSAVTLHTYTDEDLNKIRADTIEAAADQLAERYLAPEPGGFWPGLTYDYGPKIADAHGAVPWLRARAAEYRKAASA